MSLDTLQTDRSAQRRELLALLQQRLCDDSTSVLARHIGRDPSYMSRLLYPEGKPGGKKIGLTIMNACTAVFGLPPGFWEMDPQGAAQRLAALDSAAGSVGAALPPRKPAPAGAPAPLVPLSQVGSPVVRALIEKLLAAGAKDLVPDDRAVAMLQEIVDLERAAAP